MALERKKGTPYACSRPWDTHCHDTRKETGKRNERSQLATTSCVEIETAKEEKWPLRSP